MLRPEKNSKSNGTLKILDGPIHLASMADNLGNNVEEIKSIWVTQRDDTLVTDVNLSITIYCIYHFRKLMQRS